MGGEVTIELTQDEAEIVIAVLVYAEGSAALDNPGMAEALRVLQPWRSELLRRYMVMRLKSAYSEEPK